MFHVGQKVVCVDVRIVDGHLRPLAKGCVYTIRQLATRKGHPAVFLAEIDRTDDEGPDDPFYAWRFRPVINTDISIFKAMLVNPPKELVE
jgi:hypothetical protein